MTKNGEPEGVFLGELDREDSIRGWLMTLSIEELEELEKRCDDFFRKHPQLEHGPGGE